MFGPLHLHIRSFFQSGCRHSPASLRTAVPVFLATLMFVLATPPQVQAVRHARSHSMTGVKVVADNSHSKQTSRTKDAKAAQESALRAEPWAFGAGQSAQQWGSRGVAGGSLQQKALSGQNSRKKAARGQSAANRQNRQDQGGLDLSVDRENDTWRPSPEQQRAGENVAIESQHRVRAFATVKDENLSIGLGPEVYVRDRTLSNPALAKREDQPDVDAGVGMQFKLDF